MHTLSTAVPTAGPSGGAVHTTSPSQLSNSNQPAQAAESSAVAATAAANGNGEDRKKPWRILAELLGGSSLRTADQGYLVREAIEKSGSFLDIVSFAEIAVLLGTIMANPEHFDAACDVLSEAVERSANFSALTWRNVFLSLPRVDSRLKINTLGCFAFLLELFRRKIPNERFPVEIGFQERWPNPHSQVLFIKWTVVGNSFAAYSNYQQVPFLFYLRGIEIPVDRELLQNFPEELLGGEGNRIWTNEVLLNTLLELADDSNSGSCGNDPDHVQAASIAFELLRRPTVTSAALLLATLVKSTLITPALGRPLAADCLEVFWTRVQSHDDICSFTRWLATLNPLRFSTVVICAAYTRNPGKLADVVAAVKPNRQLLLEVLNGPPSPFRFHVSHLAWSADFNTGLWLRDRVRNDSTGEVSKEFLLFLILSLCPMEILQQKLPPGVAHPKKRLQVSPQELMFYLSVIIGASQDPEVACLKVEESWEAICAKPPDVIEAELTVLKQTAAKLLPQLTVFIQLIKPSTPPVDNPPAASTVLEPSAPHKGEDSVGMSVNPETLDSSLEQAVYHYFAVLYGGAMSCDGMLELMRKFSRSPPQSHEYVIFHYMVKLLFHECRFFPKYPLPELALTAQLMGKLILHEILVGHGPQGTTHLLAFRCVLEALRKGEATKMFRFGVTALEQFVGSRIVSCPDFLTALVSLPDVREHFPSYIAYAESCLQALPVELSRMRYIDNATLSNLILPPPPVPIYNSPYSLSMYQGADAGQADISNEPVVPFTSADGVPKQRHVMLNGRPISLGGFGLGAVEQVLSAEPFLQVFEPPLWFRDQVAQIFNSLVITNSDQKVQDLRSLLQPKWYEYLALYVVKTRASKETNLHTLYRSFIENIGFPKLLEIVVNTTYDCINVLLSYCDDARESVAYRTVLKNLGAWLGTMTLARNFPLRSKSLDLKSLLFDGFENGRLKVLLPLCCKVLEGVGQSRSFRPPNPWSVGVFSLLAEIHGVPGLVTPIIFEIEVLFKNLALSLAEFRGRTSNLAKRSTPIKDSLDFATKRVDNTGVIGQQPPEIPLSTLTVNQPTVLQDQSDLKSQLKESVAHALSSVTAAAATQEPASFADLQNLGKASLAADSVLAQTFGPAVVPTAPTRITPTPLSLPTAAEGSVLGGLLKSAVISPSLALFQLKPALKIVVPHAIERAIMDVVDVVSERSAAISCITTSEIVLKDFASELNDSLVRRAAHLMAASLAGSLALATCREPLRANLCQHLRTLLISSSDRLGEDQRLVDQVVTVAAADNIELGCSLVEEAVIQRTLHDVEECIAPALLARKQARALGAQRYKDPAYYNQGSRWPNNLPAQLQLSATITAEQLQVYKNFLQFGSLRRMQINKAGGTTPPPQQPVKAQNALSFEAGTAGTVRVPEGVATGLIGPTGLLSPDTAGRDSECVISSRGDLQPALLKVDEYLSFIKDVILEITSCSTIFSFTITPETVFCKPVGSCAKFVDNVPCVNTSLLTLSRLPPDHAIFIALASIPTTCSVCKADDTTYLSVCQRVLKMITDLCTRDIVTPTAPKGADITGLYMEAFLCVLKSLVSLPKFPTAQFNADLANWLSSTLDNRRSGTEITIALLRYGLLPYSQLDKVLVEQAMLSVERREVGVFENLLRIIYRIMTENGIVVENVPAALSALKGSRELLARLPVSGDLSVESTGSLSHLLGRSTISLDSNTTGAVFTDARRMVSMEMAKIISRDSYNSIHPPDILSTLSQLIKDYASLGGGPAPMVTRPLPAPAYVSASQRELVATLYHQWSLCAMVVGSARRSKVWAEYFQSLSKQRLLQMDDETEKFLSCCVDRAIEVSLSMNDATGNGSKSLPPLHQDIAVESPPELEFESPQLKPLDAFAKMVVAMMRLIDPTQISPVLILQRALSVLARCILRDASKKDGLNQQVYFRLLLSLIWEVVQPNRGLDQHLVSSLLSFVYIYQALNPCVCPAFAFCWLELISHRCFMPKLLKRTREWPHFQRLLSSLFQFLYPFLHKARLSAGSRTLYEGTLRLLLVLLHDFPEFLCDNHVTLCDNLPLNSVQLRNIILSAFPRDMKLPDPFMPNLKVDLLPQSRCAPRLAGLSPAFLAMSDIKEDLEEFWRTRDPEHLQRILPKLEYKDEILIADLGLHINVSLVNALLLYVATELPNDKSMFYSSGADTAAPAVKVILYLTEHLDMEGRYIVISCISNHLRFPNMHTHYFSCLLLWLFGASTKNESVQEQITRVLLERLVAHRPHPWGLLITFIELIKNPRYISIGSGALLPGASENLWKSATLARPASGAGTNPQNKSLDFTFGPALYGSSLKAFISKKDIKVVR